MIPDLQSSLVCDDVRQERNGKFILIGLFDSIAVEKLPAFFQRLCLVNRWCCGEGIFTQKNRIVGVNSQVIVEGKGVEVKLTGNSTATAIEFFMNVQFPDAGTYWMEVLLDGDLKLRYPLNVAVVKRPTDNS
jgi:hypothetical protein